MSQTVPLPASRLDPPPTVQMWRSPVTPIMAKNSLSNVPPSITHPGISCACCRPNATNVNSSASVPPFNISQGSKRPAWVEARHMQYSTVRWGQAAVMEAAGVAIGTTHSTQPTTTHSTHALSSSPPSTSPPLTTTTMTVVPSSPIHATVVSTSPPSTLSSLPPPSIPSVPLSSTSHSSSPSYDPFLPTVPVTSIPPPSLSPHPPPVIAFTDAGIRVKVIGPQQRSV